MRRSRKQKRQDATDKPGRGEAQGAQESEEKLQQSKEETQPLPTIARLTFEGFLTRYQLSMLDVARAAGVRLLTIWRVVHDLPISEQQARQGYAGLAHLAGVSYRGYIRLHAARQERPPSISSETNRVGRR
jgi:hypothetical protein